MSSRTIDLSFLASYFAEAAETSTNRYPTVIVTCEKSGSCGFAIEPPQVPLTLDVTASQVAKHNVSRQNTLRNQYTGLINVINIVRVRVSFQT